MALVQGGVVPGRLLGAGGHQVVKVVGGGRPRSPWQLLPTAAFRQLLLVNVPQGIREPIFLIASLSTKGTCHNQGQHHHNGNSHNDSHLLPPCYQYAARCIQRYTLNYVMCGVPFCSRSNCRPSQLPAAARDGRKVSQRRSGQPHSRGRLCQ